MAFALLLPCSCQRFPGTIVSGYCMVVVCSRDGGTVMIEAVFTVALGEVSYVYSGLGNCLPWGMGCGLQWGRIMLGTMGRGSTFYKDNGGFCHGLG